MERIHCFPSLGRARRFRPQRITLWSENLRMVYGYCFLLHNKVRNFNSREGFSGLRISKGSTNIVFFFSAWFGGFDYREGLSGGSTNVVFFFSARSEDFDSREGLSGMRISRGNIDIAFFLLVGLIDFDSSVGLSQTRISGGRTNASFNGMHIMFRSRFFNILRYSILSKSSSLKLGRYSDLAA